MSSLEIRNARRYRQVRPGFFVPVEPDLVGSLAVSIIVSALTAMAAVAVVCGIGAVCLSVGG